MDAAADAVKFYEVLATVSFTLLGLWFAVLGITDRRWRESPASSRRILHVAGHFVLPGLIGMVSVLSGGIGVLWRAAFLVGGLVGLAEAVSLALGHDRFRTRTTWTFSLLDVPLYGLLIVPVFFSTPLLGVSPLQIEGVLTSVLFAVGLGFVWSSLPVGPVPPGAPPPFAQSPRPGPGDRSGGPPPAPPGPP